MRFSLSVIAAFAAVVSAAPLSPLPRDPSSVYHSYLRDREASPEPEADPSSVYHSYLRD